MKTTLRTIVTGAFAALVLVGCSENTNSTSPGETGGEAEQPTLPSPETLRFDMSFFDNGEERVAQYRQSENQTYFNWMAAVGRIIVINTAVAQALYAPHLAFALAIHTVPSYQGDDTWLWVYTWVDPGGREVQIRLRGHVNKDDEVVEWNVFLSDSDATPPLDQVLWFSGDSNLDDTGGYWIFNDIDTPGAPEVARVDYTEVSSVNAELLFTIVGDGHEDEGNTLRYAVQGAIVSIELFDASESYTADITWNEETGAGSLMFPGHNGGERGCWDETAQDVECEIAS